MEPQSELSMITLSTVVPKEVGEGGELSLLPEKDRYMVVKENDVSIDTSNQSYSRYHNM